MGDLSDFQRDRLLVCVLAGAYVTKPATLCGVSRVAVVKVMTEHTSNGRTLLAERNSGRKPKQS